MTLDDIIPPRTQPEVLGQGYGFTEGPAADRDGAVYFSDGQNNSIHRWQPGDCPDFRLGENGTAPLGPRSAVTLFTDDSTDAIGMMFNAAGELYVCEGAAQRIVAYQVSGDCPDFAPAKMGLSPSTPPRTPPRTPPSPSPARQSESSARRSTASTSTSRTTWRSTSTAASISPIPTISTTASRP